MVYLSCLDKMDKEASKYDWGALLRQRRGRPRRWVSFNGRPCDLPLLGVWRLGLLPRKYSQQGLCVSKSHVFCRTFAACSSLFLAPVASLLWLASSTIVSRTTLFPKRFAEKQSTHFEHVRKGTPLAKTSAIAFPTASCAGKAEC